ncbi:MAG TPA: phosphotransferase [Streptosporangiaceae bacterium]|nr:phosphotransferase [Streptosporangiaceae bacterium]
MTDAASPPGPLIGSGRAADVYALDGGKVLRRYRTEHSCAAEAGLMSYLRGAGYPVPEVFAADGTDLVMQRLHGRDMLADLASRPWRVARHARTLARLHDELHQIAAPAGLRRFGPGGRVLHLDLHPGNVMLTANGPFVIDWSNGCAGEAGADVAMAYLIMASSDVDGLPSWLAPVAGGLRRLFLRRFLAAVRDDSRPHLARVAAYRLEDPNVRPAEAARLRRLAGLAAAGPGAAGAPDAQKPPHPPGARS